MCGPAEMMMMTAAHSDAKDEDRWRQLWAIAEEELDEALQALSLLYNSAPRGGERARFVLRKHGYLK